MKSSYKVKQVKEEGSYSSSSAKVKARIASAKFPPKPILKFSHILYSPLDNGTVWRTWLKGGPRKVPLTPRGPNEVLIFLHGSHEETELHVSCVVGLVMPTYTLQ
jgi:hypothetical protein